MAKIEDVIENATPVVAIGAKAAEVKEFPLALEEFCARLSGDDKRVELIGGFHRTEKAAGRNKDTESAYKARYAVFANQPA